MFARRLSIERIDIEGAIHPCDLHWIDNFAMRNFTNNAVFDDTLPAEDGVLEAGHRVQGLSEGWRGAENRRALRRPQAATVCAAGLAFQSAHSA